MVFGDTRGAEKFMNSRASFYLYMKSIKHFYFFIFTVLVMCSCSAPTYIVPDIKTKCIVNEGIFSVQNMDNKGLVESQSLTTHYEGFDVRYKFVNNFVPTFEIVNKTNKSLIIDKSKCYVLYNGYSRDLFKDVRLSRSTTYNNVQDAINNVQTSDASVMMSIPPYSKWELPLSESNVKNIEKLPNFIEKQGTYPMQSYDNQEPVEFVIPYSFDYALGKWETSRNRVYVGQIEVYIQDELVLQTPKCYGANNYIFGKKITISDKNEIDRINEINIKKWKSHRHKVNASNIFWGTVTVWTIYGPFWALGNNANCRDCHRPVIYNSDGSFRVYDKKTFYKSEY